MHIISLRQGDPSRDFGTLAALFSLEQDEPTTESGLMKDYEIHKDRILRITVAEDDKGTVVGFNWATRSRFDANHAYFYVIVEPEKRHKGVGSRLYTDFYQAMLEEKIKKVEISIRDTCPECRLFADHRGFVEKSHSRGFSLDLSTFDDRPYDEILEKLKREGFQFTSMQELGDTEDTQRNLYRLNDTASRETLGTDGSPSWTSFEDFRKHVCGSDWYKPAGQLVVIDTNTGIWAAMSAITRFTGTDYAYNLFTGVDKRYRRRKLGLAVKVLALRYARDVLKVTSVHTHHNSKNPPMINLDHKLGYHPIAGQFVMEKEIIASGNIHPRQ
jgi:GNAT superfamily N-acetyltransferase